MPRLPPMAPGGLGVEDGQRVPLAREVIGHAAHHERGAVPGRLSADLFRREPHRPHDSGIQRAGRVDSRDDAGKCEADIGHLFPGGTILVDPQQLRRFEAMRGFLERFARDGADQGLAFVEMARRLVVEPAAPGVLLDEEKAAVALDHGGDRHVGFPDHGRRILPPARSAPQSALQTKRAGWKTLPFPDVSSAYFFSSAFFLPSAFFFCSPFLPSAFFLPSPFFCSFLASSFLSAAKTGAVAETANIPATIAASSFFMSYPPSGFNHCARLRYRRALNRAGLA